MGNELTENDIQSFRQINEQDKIRCMEAYLINHVGTMQDVGERIFYDRNASFTVSLIHRAYNFSQRNGGRYKNGCAFERKYNYHVSTADIEAFVRKYPNGCWQNEYSFEQFLIERATSFHKQNQRIQSQNNTRQAPYQSSNQSIPKYTQKQKITSRKESNSNFSNKDMDELGHFGFIIGVVFLVLYLIWKLIKYVWGVFGNVTYSIGHNNQMKNIIFFVILFFAFMYLDKKFFKK